jgi:nucleotide-binding universal stress UspA family protein
MFKHILIATDGSPASVHAAALAVDLARIHASKLMAIYVVDPYPYMLMGEANPYGFQAYMTAAQTHAAEAHAAVAALCSQGGAPVELQVRLIENVAAPTGIIECAQEVGADLIVIGSHGRSGIMRLMLGSVASRVVAESKVPVLVAR